MRTSKRLDYLPVLVVLGPIAALAGVNVGATTLLHATTEIYEAEAYLYCVGSLVLVQSLVFVPYALLWFRTLVTDEPRLRGASFIAVALTLGSLAVLLASRPVAVFIEYFVFEGRRP
jgi:hypothetical protein